MRPLSLVLAAFLLSSCAAYRAQHAGADVHSTRTETAARNVLPDPKVVAAFQSQPLAVKQSMLISEIDLIYGGGTPMHPAMRRMAPVAREAGIPPEPMHALVQANRMDQTVSSFATFEDLLSYCALSANPVGHMVLCVFDAATPERIELSDAVCSALQVTEHLQDVREDLERGRVYLPQADLARFGCDETDLSLSPSPERVRALVAFEVERARRLFDRGEPLLGTLRGRARLAVTGFVAGGRAALGGIERAGFALGTQPPRPSWPDRIAALAQTARSR
jgi:squalene synthase HpnC